MAKDWNEEIRKIKEDKVLFFENYCLVDGEKSTKEMVEKLRNIKSDVQFNLTREAK